MEDEFKRRMEELLEQQKQHEDLLMNHLLNDERDFQRLTDHLVSIQALLAESIKAYHRNLLYGIGAVGGVVIVVELVTSYLIRLL